MRSTLVISMPKMKKASSIKYHAMHFLPAYILVSVFISLTSGSFHTVSETTCEYEDANVIWRNTQEYSLSDVKAIAWSKENDSLIATWLEKQGFMESPPYIGRLMQIGETGIKIKTANRSDSGIYWLSLTLASVAYKLETSTYLEVKVAPSKLCKPKITQEGSLIKADLPYDGCGIPHLRARWKHKNMTITQEQQNSSSFLDMRTNPEPGEYVACAEGESATCYKGNISDLCSTHITGGLVKKAAKSEHTSSKEQKKSKDCEMSTNEDASVTTSQAKQPKKKKRMKLSDIEKYLKKLYEGLVTVPISPDGKGDHYVNISDLYVNIALTKIEITDLNNEESNVSSATQSEIEPLMDNKFSPILMFGDCGSGKSAWCKHLVQSWLQGVDIKDDYINLNLPDMQKIKILLYLPLQYSDRGISFQELLEKHIFKETQSYQEFVMNYVKTNAQEVLLVMDGLDIVKENIKPIVDILNDADMSLSTVIITSRPASLKLLQDSCNIKIEQIMLFRVCKMALEDSKLYASNVLSHINKLCGKNFKVDNFWRFTKQFHVHDLLCVPYICLVLLHIWMKNKNYFSEITDILFDIILSYLHNSTSDQQRKEFIEDISYIRSRNVHMDLTKLDKWTDQKEHKYLLNVLGRIAAQILYSEMEKEPIKLNVTQLFPRTDEDDSDLQRICETGLLTEPLSLSADKKVSDMLFPHRIICVFFFSIFITLQEGIYCDFILSSRIVSLQNSMIMNILCQLSPTLTKSIINQAIKNYVKEKRNTMGDQRNNCLNEKCWIFLTPSDACPVLWLHWLMCNDALNAEKLLFLSTALHCIDTITSLKLINHDNNENLVFQLPFLKALKSLTLDINKCTLLLCKEWDDHLPCEITQVVIRSVNISKGTLSLLISSLEFCAGLEKLELFPSKFWTDDDIDLQTRTDLNSYSWKKLSNHIENCKKLKTLELSSLILPGEVDKFLARLNRYQNLEMLKLKNVSSITQETPPLSRSSNKYNDNDAKPHMKVNLTQLSLERLKLKQSPIDFLFNPATKGKSIENNINVLSISALEMPETSWETLGSQIGNLRLTEFHLSNVNIGDSLQNLLDGIGESKTLNCLSLCKLGTEKMILSFSFLQKIKTLSCLTFREMKLDGSSSCSLFNEICGCKQLQNLSLCNIDAEEIPETLSSVQTLRKLSVLTVYRVTMKSGSAESLRDILNAFSKCENLQTINISTEHSVSIPAQLSSHIKVIYLEKY